MKKRLIAVAVLILFALSLSFVLGDEFFEFSPSIDFKGNPDSIYVVKISDALTTQGIKSIVFEVGQTGRENANFGTNSEMVNVLIFLVNSSQEYFKNHTFIDKINAGTFATDELILLDVVNGKYNALTFEGLEGNRPIDYVPETTENETDEDEESAVVEETDVQEESSDAVADEGLTGFSIFDTLSGSEIVYIIVGLVLIAGGVVFFIMRRGHSKEPKEPEEPKVVKLSELQKKQSDEKIGGAEERLARAEQELKEAKEEIQKIKNKKVS